MTSSSGIVTRMRFQETSEPFGTLALWHSGIGINPVVSYPTFEFCPLRTEIDHCSVLT